MPAQKRQVFREEFRFEKSEAPRARSWAAETLAKAGLSERTIPSATAAVAEAFYNAVRHGAKGPINIAVRHFPERFEVSVYNTAKKGQAADTESCERRAKAERNLQNLALDAKESVAKKAEEALQRQFPSEAGGGGFGTMMLKKLAHCYDLKTAAGKTRARMIWYKKQL